MRGGLLLVVLLAVMLGAVGLLVLDGDGIVAGLDDERFASLAYAGLWAGVLATGLVTVFRSNLGQAVRSLAIWALVFAALIGVYAFAGEFRAVGDRMLAVLLPGHAIRVAGEEGRIMVVRAGDDHFHLNAEVNGEPVSFLVDTGASVVVLDRAAAESAGIRTGDLAYTARMQTANGIAAAAPVFLRTLKVGPIERRDVRAVVAEGDRLGGSLLGMSFLGTLSSFDFRGDRLVLTD